MSLFTLTAFIATPVGATLSEYIISKNWFSKTAVRKAIAVVGNYVLSTKPINLVCAD